MSTQANRASFTLDIAGVEHDLRVLEFHAQEGKRDPELTAYRWWLEEYRVSLFAQQLGTKMPVSDKRLSKQWGQVEG